MVKHSNVSRFNCYGGYIQASNERGSDTRITYCRPRNPSDAKRYGTELVIDTGSVCMILNGTQIRSLVSVLKRVT